jgi:hypothetical protein
MNPLNYFSPAELLVLVSLTIAGLGTLSFLSCLD